jgi:hypothetical protein
MAALRALKATDTGGSRKLAGAILLSDGADNAELQAGLQTRQSDELGAWASPSPPSGWASRRWWIWRSRE